MDIQKVELHALSDDQLDAVSGGDNKESQQKAQEDKKAMEWINFTKQVFASII